MKTRPHRIQLAALILATASMTSAMFPNTRSRVGPAPLQSGTGFSEEYPGRLAVSDLNEAVRRLPLTFETNRGQAEADVEFVGRANDFALLLKTE